MQQQRRERFREILDPNLSDAAADHLSTSNGGSAFVKSLIQTYLTLLPTI
jgi:hypothetical protein